MSSLKEWARVKGSDRPSSRRADVFRAIDDRPEEPSRGGADDDRCASVSQRVAQMVVQHLLAGHDGDIQHQRDEVDIGQTRSSGAGHPFATSAWHGAVRPRSGGLNHLNDHAVEGVTTFREHAPDRAVRAVDGHAAFSCDKQRISPSRRP